MLVEAAQREVRIVFVGGFAGQLVSAVLWAASAAAASSVSLRAGVLVLVLGGIFIFPLTQLCLRLAGRRAALSPGNPFGELAMEVAFQVPLLLPLAGAATLYKAEWFYPACMVIVGAHYLPFSFLYGMRMFLALGGLMIAGGLSIGLYLPSMGTTGAFLSSLLMLVFAFAGRSLAARSQ